MIDMMLTERLNSGYFNSQHCSKQWRSFIQVFVEEIYQTAGDEDARAFYAIWGPDSPPCIRFRFTTVSKIWKNR